MIDIGEAGRQSDAGVFANSKLGHAIMKDLLPLPKPRNLPGSKELVPYVFIESFLARAFVSTSAMFTLFRHISFLRAKCIYIIYIIIPFV